VVTVGAKLTTRAIHARRADEMLLLPQIPAPPCGRPVCAPHGHLQVPADGICRASQLRCGSPPFTARALGAMKRGVDGAGPQSPRVAQLALGMAATAAWLALALRALASPPSAFPAAVEKPGSGAAGVAVLVTAHPDDEALFFAPTVQRLVAAGWTVRLLCLSTGVCCAVRGASVGAPGSAASWMPACCRRCLRWPMQGLGSCVFWKPA
jgi:hypothetical protein